MLGTVVRDTQLIFIRGQNIVDGGCDETRGEGIYFYGGF